MTREDTLVKTFVMLADTLVDSYDIIDFLQTLAEGCVRILDVSAAGIMLANSEGKLQHVACSSEQMRLVELFELQLEEGPCFEAFRLGQAILCESPHIAEARWPKFAPRATEGGFIGVAAVPMRLRDQVIGALNLFSSKPVTPPPDDVRVAQALADVATIGILQERMIRDSRALSAQLEQALKSRIAIEQAKGVVAERNKVDVDQAFEQLRGFARRHNRLLGDVCQQIVAGSIRPETLRLPTSQRHSSS